MSALKTRAFYIAKGNPHVGVLNTKYTCMHIYNIPASVHIIVINIQTRLLLLTVCAKRVSSCTLCVCVCVRVCVRVHE